MILCVSLAQAGCATTAVTAPVALPAAAVSQKENATPATAIAPTVGPSIGDTAKAAEILRRDGRDTTGDGSALSDALKDYLAPRRLCVYFEPGSLDLTEEALAKIADNAERLKANRSIAVTLVGFTDDLGSSSYSVALAQRRAAAVTNALIKLGVASYQIRSTAYGQEQSEMAPCTTEACRTAYSRVEFRYAEAR